MLTEDITKIDREFTVGDLTFRVAEIEYEDVDLKLDFSVRDSGGLEVGSFNAFIDDNGNIDYDDEQGDHPETLERLRQTGDSNKVALNIQKIIHGLQVK